MHKHQHSSKKNSTSSASNTLAVAAASLLSQVPLELAAAEPWEVDTSLFIYSEDDNRVQDISFKSLANRVLDNEDTISIGLQLDSLTGASPTGAAPQTTVQTFTRPSGNGQYQIAAGETPLDDTFRDSRLALNTSWQRELDNLDKLTVGASLSREFDYTHLGVNTGLSRDINQRNTSLSVALAFSADHFDPVGGTPTPLADVIASSLGKPGGEPKGSSENKQIVDLVIGATQIINRRSLFQVNYSLSIASGYLNDPYKFLSVVDGSGVTIAGAAADSLLFRYESRPDKRIGHNLFAAYKYHFDTAIADLSYRLHTDDWGITSHTFEARYRQPLGAKFSIEPHLRLYNQSAADFYRPFLPSDQAPPSLASSDYRLAEFSATTIGLKFIRSLGSDNELSLRVEAYNAAGNAGSLPNSKTDLYPDLTAAFVQLNYRFKW